jgi:hypothetical protein
LSTNRRYNRIKVSNQIGCCGIEFAEIMLRGIWSVLKEIVKMVINYKFKYFGKITKNRNRSVITNNGAVAFFKHRNNSSFVSTMAERWH